jgi:hypothetical protein
VELEREQYFEYPYRIISEKFVRLLDTGQLIGDPFNSGYRSDNKRVTRLTTLHGDFLSSEIIDTHSRSRRSSN